MRATLAALAFALVLALVGCSGKIEKTPLKLEDVPPNIMKMAKEQLPDVEITEAYKEGPNYELRGKNKKGKVCEVDISPEGKVVEVVK
jgi:hypothetical protein